MSTTPPPASERIEEIRVLHVDDEPSFADMAATFLEHEDDRFTVETVASAGKGLDRLDETQFDCVVSDYEMPQQNGIEFLISVRESHPELPFILFTGKGSEEIASEAISAGVTDYLQKGSDSSRYTVLANRINNVVEQFRSRQTIAETERKLSQLAEHTDDILFMFNADWSELLFINSAYEEIWGDSIDELHDDPKAFLQYIHPEDRGGAIEAVEQIQNGESNDIEYRVRHPDGEQRWIHGKTKPLVDDDGDVFRIVGYVRDITDHKERERELQRKERRYRAVFNDSNILVGSLDTDGRVLDINDTAIDYISGTRDDVIGEPFWETPWFDHAVPMQRRVKDWIERAVDGEYVEFEADHSRADGTTFTVEGVIRPVTNDAGDVVSLLVSDRDVTEKKERTNELEQTNALLSTLFDALPQGVLVEDDSRTVLAANQRLFDLFEMPGSAEEVVGADCERIAEAVSDMFDDAERFIERIDELTTEREPVDGEVLALADGRTFEQTHLPIELPHGDGHLWMYRDVTDRKEAERQLHDEQQFIQSIFHSLPDPLYTFDIDGYPIRWNEKCESVTGYSGTEIEKMHVTEFVPEDEVETIAENFRAILEGGRAVTVESAFETNDGTRIPYEFTGGPLEAADGTIRGVTGIGRDITKRTALEERLKALNRTSQELMSAETREEVVKIGVETSRDLLGLDANSIQLYDDDIDGLVPVAVTDAVNDFVAESPTFKDNDSIAWRVYNQGEPLKLDDVDEDPDLYNPDTSVQNELYLPLGEFGIMNATSPSGETFDDQDVLLGEILAGGLVRALEQVEQTEQLRTREEELTRQNDQLEAFISIVSHDLRNPLTVAEGRVKLANEECDSDHLEHVERAHARMRTLIKELLILAREGETVGDMSPVALTSLVEGCWRTVETDDARLVTDIDRTVQADESRLKQVFENLIRNAVEHGGTDVTIRIGEVADGFYVEDDGPGIPPKERESVFDAGYSTSEDGTGFGLSIVNQIVEAHEWGIHVTDGTEGGARFEITGVETANDQSADEF